MAIIYTNQSSGAIRKARRRKPTKAYLESLRKHIKYLKKIFYINVVGHPLRGQNLIQLFHILLLMGIWFIMMVNLMNHLEEVKFYLNR